MEGVSRELTGDEATWRIHARKAVALSTVKNVPELITAVADSAR